MFKAAVQVHCHCAKKNNDHCKKRMSSALVCVYASILILIAGTMPRGYPFKVGIMTLYSNFIHCFLLYWYVINLFTTLHVGGT